ncbi:hypothetical protein [Nonomuraea sp. NPDC005650]|uniref:hypothetical protein n=1 Tax=Nonomuraea sp. NPDC005650 TaxID=3157045 RepID=UPI0033B2B1C7
MRVVVTGARMGGLTLAQGLRRAGIDVVVYGGLEGVVRFGAEFARFGQQADGTVWMRFADDRTDTADVLVGADGIGSMVRRKLLPQVQVADTGQRTLMGATPVRAAAGTGLPELTGDDATCGCARDTMMVLGVLRFGRRPTAARDRLLPDLRNRAVDYVMWATPATQEWLGPTGSPEQTWRRARELVTEWHPALPRIVEHDWRERTVPLRIGTIAAMQAWAPSPVTVIGDAMSIHELSHRSRSKFATVAEGRRSGRRSGFCTLLGPPAIAACAWRSR